MEKLIERGASIKRQIDTLNTELREVNAEIANHINFDGKKSATVFGNGIECKVALRENVKWDQTKLLTVKQHFPDDFNGNFKTEYKPNRINSCNAEFIKAIEWAKEVKPGAPSVTYQIMGEN